LERWLDITKSTLFFAKGIILVEGIAEALVIKELAKRVIKEVTKDEIEPPNTLEDYGVSIINLNGIYFRHFFQLFQGYTLLKPQEKDGIPEEIKVDYIPIRCAGITDCDPKKDSMPTNDSKMRSNNPQYYLIDEIAAHSTYCRLYSNLKTFEYDLGMTENNLCTLYDIYIQMLITDGANRLTANEYKDINWLQENDEEKAHACKWLLDHIENQKGEFAQRLAKKLNDEPELDFTTPQYIEDAIRWVINKPRLSND
jgi:predicted ATP-dependent endonuclease of OLD family